jgi:DNA repair protein RadC
MTRRSRSLGEADSAESSLFPEEVPPPGHLGHRARMRRRLLQSGPEALLDHEMIEMLLFLALPRRDTKPMARLLLERFGDFAGVIAAPSSDLLGIEGLGEAGTAALKLAQGAALRLSTVSLTGRVVLNRWDQLAAHLAASMAREPTEQVRVLFLDVLLHLLADEMQGRGTVNHSPAYPREVAKRALALNAVGVILVHNHPSGDPTPSRADIETARQMKIALAALGIELHDHVIVGRTGLRSLRRDGLID